MKDLRINVLAVVTFITIGGLLFHWLALMS